MGGKACLVIPYDANGKNYEGAGGGDAAFFEIGYFFLQENNP